MRSMISSKDKGITEADGPGKGRLALDRASRGIQGGRVGWGEPSRVQDCGQHQRPEYHRFVQIL